MKKTLLKYVIKSQARATCGISLFVFLLIYLFTYADVIRIAKYSNYEMLVVSFYKSFDVFSMVINYIYFIAAVFTLWSLSKSHQLIIFKSSGKSPREILRPFMIFSVTMGMVWIFGIHNLGILSQRYVTQLGIKHSSVTKSQNSNIWMDFNDTIIYANSVQNNILKNVKIYNLKNLESIFAQNAKIEDEDILLDEAFVFGHDCDGTNSNKLKNYKYRHGMKKDIFLMMMIRPQLMTFYELCKVIKMQLYNGMNCFMQLSELFKLLSTLLSFILFPLLAAVICFPLSRYKTKTYISSMTIFYVLLLRFCTNIIDVLCQKGIFMNPFIICFPTIAMISAAIGVIIWKEE